MTEARSQHRLGIALVVAAAIAWSTAPFFTRLLPYDFLDHPVLARIVRRRHDHGPDGAVARPRRLAGSGQDRQQRLAGRVVFDIGDDRLHPFAAAHGCLQCRHHHRDRPLPRGRAGLDMAAGRSRICEPCWRASWRFAASSIIVGGARAGSDILGIALACFMALAIAAMTVMVRRHRNTSMVAAAAMSNFLGSVISIPFAHGIAGDHRLRPAHSRDVRMLSGRARPHAVLPRLAPAAVRPGGADLHAGDAADAVLDMGGIWRVSRRCGSSPAAPW